MCKFCVSSRMSIRQVVYHRWVAPRVSVALLELTPAVNEDFFVLGISGKNKATAPATIGVSCGPSPDGPFVVVLERAPMLNVGTKLRLPRRHDAPFYRIEMSGALAIIAGIERHEVFLSVSPDSVAERTVHAPTPLRPAALEEQLITPPPVSADSIDVSAVFSYDALRTPVAPYARETPTRPPITDSWTSESRPKPKPPPVAPPPSPPQRLPAPLVEGMLVLPVSPQMTSYTGFARLHLGGELAELSEEVRQLEATGADLQARLDAARKRHSTAVAEAIASGERAVAVAREDYHHVLSRLRRYPLRTPVRPNDDVAPA